MFNISRTPKPVIVVSGLPRTGTSLMMTMLKAGGIPPATDGIRQADEDNPLGYYELEAVKSLAEGNIQWLTETVGKAVKIVTAHLPHLPQGHDYKIIIMERLMPEVMASQRILSERRGKNQEAVDEVSLADQYRQHLEQTFQWMENAKNVDFIRVSYNQLVANPSPLIEKVNDFLGGSLDTKSMMTVIDPSLYRQRMS